MRCYIFLLLIAYVGHLPFCLAHDHGGGDPSVGKGKGVESYDEHEGFKLSKEAIKRLDILTKTIPLESCKEAEVVAWLDQKEIFILRGQNFKSAKADCSEIKTGDQVVIKGASFLRVIEMNLTPGEEDEHDEHSEHEGRDEHNHKKVDSKLDKVNDHD